jgi:ATP-dependent Lhr-like helicase
VRERMRELLDSDSPVPFLDQGAQRFLEQGRKTYGALELDKRFILDTGRFTSSSLGLATRQTRRSART